VVLQKNYFEEFVILEFSITNNCDEHEINEVFVHLTFQTDNLKIVEQSPILSISCQKTEKCKIIVAKNPQTPIVSTPIQCMMKFNVIEKNHTYEDEYQVEDFDISVSDYLIPNQVKNFSELWDKLNNEIS
jgi:coatomer protein complex subunit gamma